MVTTIFFQTFPKLFLPEFQKRNSWIVTVYLNENEEKSEFYNAYFIYKHYYCSVCGTVEITKKRAKRKDNYYSGHTCKTCNHSDFLNLLSNNEFFKAKNISFELFENQDFYHIQPYVYIPFVNYENKVIDKKQMYTNDNNDITEGSIISHEQYGTGVVVKCDGSLISVAFKTGIKKLMKNHKSIKKIN